MKEIVCARLGGNYVTNDPLKIKKALDGGADVELFDRAFARKMAGFFAHWKSIADGQTLCLMDESGQVHAVSEEVETCRT